MLACIEQAIKLEGQLSVVLFRVACEHIIRITRLVGLQNGHMLLVGDQGNGKRTLTSLAAFLVQASARLIEVSGRSKQKEFRSELFESMVDCVMADKPQLTIVYDSAQADVGFL